MIGNLAGRVALVTGGGSGIGKAVCQVLAREGAKVVVADLNALAAESTASELQAIGGKDGHIGMPVDVSVPRSVESLLSEIQRSCGQVPTIVANAAGITRDKLLFSIDEKSWDQVIDVNLKGTFLVTQVFAGAMIKNQLPGSIVNISSIVGKIGNMGQANYAASKSGVFGLTKTCAQELARSNIRVNAVLPGYIETPMTAVVPEHLREKVRKMIPMKRMGNPEEVAEVVLFLASDKSSYMTGACVEVTGGLAM